MIIYIRKVGRGSIGKAESCRKIELNTMVVGNYKNLKNSDNYFLISHDSRCPLHTLLRNGISLALSIEKCSFYILMRIILQGTLKVFVVLFEILGFSLFKQNRKGISLICVLDNQLKVHVCHFFFLCHF